MRSVEIRVYRPGDEDEILVLYESSYGREKGMARWNWHFRQNPFGKSHVVLAFAGTECVGQYALSPMPLSLGESDSRAWIAYDHMIHPDFQGQGLYAQIERFASASLPEPWPHYGFPNQKSFPILTGKFGWLSLGKLDVYVRSATLGYGRRRHWWMGPASLAVRAWDRVFAPGARRMDFAPVDRFGTDFDRFWAENRRSLGITIARSSSYLNWRFLDGPEQYRSFAVRRAGELVGYAVVKVEQRFGRTMAWVMDAVIAGKEGPSGLAALLAQTHAAVCGECEGVGILLPHRSLRSALRAAGFVRLPRRFLPHETWFILKRGRPGAVGIESLDGWYLTWGMNDIP